MLVFVNAVIVGVVVVMILEGHVTTLCKLHKDSWLRIHILVKLH